jgi:hypothetical protein
MEGGMPDDRTLDEVIESASRAMKVLRKARSGGGVVVRRSGDHYWLERSGRATNDMHHAQIPIRPGLRAR